MWHKIKSWVFSFWHGSICDRCGRFQKNGYINHMKHEQRYKCATRVMDGTPISLEEFDSFFKLLERK